jgi:hypothetical protein
MCDTLVALPTVTKGGNLVFAKNSDREPDEAQALLLVSHRTHAEKSISAPSLNPAGSRNLCMHFIKAFSDVGC